MQSKIYLICNERKIIKKMKTIFSKSFAILSLIVLAAFTTTETKKVDTNKSIINWVGHKVTGQHEGTITLQEGTLEFNANQLTGGNFVMDMTTINTTDLQGVYKNKLDGHLKADDFFGVETYKTASLIFTSVTKNGETYSVTGDLTIKNITNEITFELAVSENTASTTFQVDRTKYGIKYGSASFFDGLKDKAIYNEFDLTVSLKF
jgi:polyisoprenoid-binding protein YceI